MLKKLELYWDAGLRMWQLRDRVNILWFKFSDIKVSYIITMRNLTLVLMELALDRSDSDTFVQVPTLSLVCRLSTMMQKLFSVTLVYLQVDGKRLLYYVS